MLEDGGGALLNCFPQPFEDHWKVGGCSNDAEGAGPEAQCRERRLGASEEFVDGGSLQVHREDAPEVPNRGGGRLTSAAEEAAEERYDVLEGEAVPVGADCLHLTDLVGEVLRRRPRMP